MMGAGKSSLGRALAEASGRDFLDTDALLQQRLGRSISQIFQVYGEDAFREHETSLLQSLEPGPHVLSTGGGIVVRPENWTEMRRLGTTIYLEASLPVLVSRLERSKKKRPLLQVEDWESRIASLLEARRPLYQLADLRFPVDDMELQDGALRLLDRLTEEESC
jgi:shikimate kinase